MMPLTDQTVSLATGFHAVAGSSTVAWGIALVGYVFIRVSVWALLLLCVVVCVWVLVLYLCTCICTIYVYNLKN